MYTIETSHAVSRLFSELVDGTSGDAFILNRGDIGLLRSLDKLSPADASTSANDGATIAAHAQHVRYGLSLMNRWAREGGNPFADATWDDAWKIGAVDGQTWTEIGAGVREEARVWVEVLGPPRDATSVEVNGMIGSIVHLAYHLGAMRQIAAGARGPREG